MLRFLAALVFASLLCQCAGTSGSVAPGVREKAAAHMLVDLRRVLPHAVFDLRYGTRDNVTHQELYPKDMPCLMYIGTAQKLIVAEAKIRAQGYRLKIWDAWRPPEVQVSLFDHGGYTGMFADPSITWSRHCSGTAVDVTLTDERGRELKMPTAYDTGGALAYYIYLGPDAGVRHRLQVLQNAMAEAGFMMLDSEWWHFDDAAYINSPPPPIVHASSLGVNLPKINKPRRRS